MLDWLSKIRLEDKKITAKYHVDPRIRALGKARIDVTQRAADEAEWQRMWREPRYPFPFEWGPGWRSAFHYYVADYAAEIGFFIDVLGLPVMAFSPRFAQFSGPNDEFVFSLASAPEEYAATPPDSLRLQFSIKNYSAAIAELEKRGIQFENKPSASDATQPAVFRTPHGIAIELWPAQTAEIALQPALTDQDSLAAFWEAEEEDELDVVVTEEPAEQTILETASEAEQAEDEVDFTEDARDEPEQLEMSYENLGDADDEPQELTYEDEEDEPDAGKPPALLNRSRLASIPPSPQLKSNRTRSLEIPLKEGVLIRSRKPRTNGSANFPLREE